MLSDLIEENHAHSVYLVSWVYFFKFLACCEFRGREGSLGFNCVYILEELFYGKSEFLKVCQIVDNCHLKLVL